MVKELENHALAGRFNDIFSKATALYAENYHKAIEGVLGKAKPGNLQYAYSAQFKHNTSNLAAWKAHRMATELTGLADADEIKKAIKKYNQWQAVEYNAITARARTARQLLDFGQRTNIYPNLEWIRTRSANPREAHLNLVGLVLPINHPFWATNQPGNLYGCKCDWKQTDAPPSAVQPQSVTPSPGLDGNPINTGELITRRAGHFKSEKAEIINPAILNTLKEDAWLHFNTENGTAINAHMIHRTYELRNNIIAASLFAKTRNDIQKIEMLPTLHPKQENFRVQFYPKGFEGKPEKNADAVVYFKNGNMWVVDFKFLEGNGRNLSRHIREAGEKADYAIVALNENIQLTTKQVARTCQGLLNNNLVKAIIVVDHNGNTVFQAI